MESYEGLQLKRRYLKQLNKIHAAYIARKLELTWLDTQRIEKLGRRIMRLINRLETLPQQKLTGRELRRARREAYVIGELIKTLTMWVLEAPRQKPIKRIQRSRS